MITFIPFEDPRPLIDRWLRRACPAQFADLAPGAAPAALSALAAEVGRPLPDDLVAYWRWHDGEGDGPAASGGFFLGLDALSVVRSLDQWRAWDGLGLGDDPDMVPRHVAPGITPAYFHRGWIPIAHDGGGNHLAVDLAPGPGGTVGQVINFGRDEDALYVVSRSLGDLLCWMAHQMLDGNAMVADVHGTPFLGLRSHAGQTMLGIVANLGKGGHLPLRPRSA